MDSRSGKFPPLPLRVFLRGAALSGALVAGAVVCGVLRNAPSPARPPATSGNAPLPPPRAPTAFLKTWCFDCHGDGSRKGGLSLDDPAALTERDWDNVRRHVLLHTMPPEDEPAPADAERADFETDLLAWQAARTPAGPPPAAFRRLSRMEFACSLESLLGLDPAPILAVLPEDESAHGFDNNADMQPLPPARLEAYLAAISGAVRAALLAPPVPTRNQRVLPPDFRGDGALFPEAPDFHLSTSGQAVLVKFRTPAAGSYRWSLTAYAHQAGDAPLLLQLGDSPPQPVPKSDRQHPLHFETTLDLPAGDCVLSYRLANPLTNPRNPDPHRRQRRLLVREASLEGPLEGGAAPGPRFQEILGALPPDDAGMEEKLRRADQALSAFARLAWRRPPRREESLRLLSLTGNLLANGMRYPQAMAGALEAVVASPGFLFLPDPAQSPPELKPYALAARLSYFLQSRPPDAALLSEAARGWPDGSLRAAARRMLDGEAASAFASDFAGQWLQLRNTILASPDTALFPAATPALRAAMREESSRFFLSLIRENAPVLDLLQAHHTFVNAPLAAFYGLPAAGIPADDFVKVGLPSPDRAGLLGQASVLLLSSYPNRTSPVLRGKYILETFLGLEPPPPPPNVPTLEPAAVPAGIRAAASGAHSVRAALERHRADPGCASCHRAIDPLGFPLEIWDAIGQPAGSPDGTPEPARVFSGGILGSPADLREWLVREQGERIVRHSAGRLLTYALGRGLSPAETQSARRIADEAGGPGARFRDLILAIVDSPEFRGETTSKPHEP